MRTNPLKLLDPSQFGECKQNAFGTGIYFAAGPGQGASSRLHFRARGSIRHARNMQKRANQANRMRQTEHNAKKPDVNTHRKSARFSSSVKHFASSNLLFGYVFAYFGFEYLEELGIISLVCVQRTHR